MSQGRREKSEVNIITKEWEEAKSVSVPLDWHLICFLGAARKQISIFPKI